MSKIVFLTGGHGDIGSAIKKKFKKNNYQVIAPTSTELDLSRVDAIDEYFKKNKLSVDVLVHCAGINNPKPFSETDFEEFQKVMMVNTFSFARIVKHLLPTLKEKSGHILGIASIYGVMSRAGRAPYSMSKHAMVGLVQTLALEFGKDNIKVNALSPGFVNTALTVKNNSPEKIAELTAGIPLGRMATPEEVANTAYFLCSEENTYLTGQNIIVDGGYLAGGFQK